MKSKKNKKRVFQNLAEGSVCENFDYVSRQGSGGETGRGGVFGEFSRQAQIQSHCSHDAR